MSLLIQIGRDAKLRNKYPVNYFIWYLKLGKYFKHEILLIETDSMTAFLYAARAAYS